MKKLKMLKKSVKTSYWYLFAAAVTQAVSLGVLLASLFQKKKNPLVTILSVLALEGGTGLLLAAHLQKDISSLTVTADEADEAEEVVEIESEE